MKEFRNSMVKMSGMKNFFFTRRKPTVRITVLWRLAVIRIILNWYNTGTRVDGCLEEQIGVSTIKWVFV